MAGLFDAFWQSCMAHMEISYLFQHVMIVVSTMIVGRTKRWNLRAVGMAALLTLMMLALSNLLLTILTGSQFFVAWNIAQSLFAFFVIFPREKENPLARLILLFSQMTNLLAVMEVINDASRLGSMFGASDPLLWTLRSFSSLLMIPCALMIRYWRPSAQARIPKSTVFLPGAIWLVNTALYYFLQQTARQNEAAVYKNPWMTAMVLLFFLAMLMINLIYCYMLHRTLLLQEQLVEMQADVQDRKRVEELIAVSEENVERMREVRHDIRNQFGYLRTLADKGDISDVRKYLEELSYDFLQPLKAIDCGNKNMNAILNMEQAKAQKMGISLDFQVIVPQELPFKWSDLCSLVTNVVDNALEGCVADAGAPEVQVRMMMQGEELLLEVSNPTDKDASFLDAIHSTKEDSSAHGFGTKIVERIVRKYDGYSSYQIQDGRFQFSCVLNAEGGEKQHG